jgi:hypothetical protein
MGYGISGATAGYRNLACRQLLAPSWASISQTYRRCIQQVVLCNDLPLENHQAAGGIVFAPVHSTVASQTQVPKQMTPINSYRV